jgi:hypothetical protein
MTDQPSPARAKISDIVRDAGAVGSETSGPSMGDFGALGALVGQSAATFTASTMLGQALIDRFHLHSDDQLERTFAAPYAIAARAIVLALHAQNHRLISAIDTSTGCAIEAKGQASIFHAGGASLMLVISDAGPTVTNVTGHSSLAQLKDWGANKHILTDIFTKADTYITLLGT